MSTRESKKMRILSLFYRLVCGESISPKITSAEYGVSVKSITRDINEIKNFLLDSRELVGNAEIKYSFSSRAYSLELEHCLLSKELMVVMKIMIGSRAVAESDLLKLMGKLKSFTTLSDREMIGQLMIKEVHHYQAVEHRCGNLVDLIWRLTNCIYRQKEITVAYYKMDGSQLERRLRPFSILFSEYYFYLIAGNADKENSSPHYYRIDRITNLIEHRETYQINYADRFDEGALRKKVQLMFSGVNRKVKFEFSGLSVQAVLDRLPMSRIIDQQDGVYTIEAETYGTGINMFLLSQGAWVNVLEPKSLVEEMKSEIGKMYDKYHSADDK